MKTDNKFWYDLKNNKQRLSKQQYKTLKGQAVSGNIAGADKGLRKILHRRNGR